MSTEPPGEPPPIRVKELAAEMDVSPMTIYRAIWAGDLDAYRVGTGRGTFRIPAAARRDYLNRCRQAAVAN